MNKDEFLGKVNKARRITTFDPQRQISAENWETLLKVAQAAPSSNGLEPWRILQIDDSALRQKIAELAPGNHGQLETASKFIFFVKVKLDAAYKKHMLQEIHGWSKSSFLGFGPKFQALQKILLDINFEAWRERQASIALGQIMLAAGILDIDCCPMEGFYYRKVAKILREAGVLAIGEKLAVAVAFGYRAEEAKHEKTRRPLAEIVKII